MQIQALIAQAQQSLRQALALDSAAARFEVQLLLQNVLNVNRAWLISHEHDALEANIHAGFEALLKRRLEGEPIAYLLGKREFYGLDLRVTPDTLIPRPDTETLVEAALAKMPEYQPCAVLDLGTGSGAIALAIAKQRPMAQVTAVDASPAALAIAQMNAQHLNINNAQFVLSDWFTALQGQTFDLIVSNPPYVAEDDPHLSQGDVRFEPSSALVAGSDGLDCIRKIIREAKEYLKPDSSLILEHGYDQAGSVRLLLEKAGFTQVRSERDFGGNERISLGKN